MSQLAQTFENLRARNERAFIPFVTCGDPDLGTSRALIEGYIEAGADVIEIGIPFTDPLADGPTIQRASERALAAGTTMSDALQLVGEVKRKYPEVPLVPMTYVNPVYQIGYEDFARRCAEVGVDAVIISDLPPEAGTDWSEAAKRHGVGTVFLIAPTSDDARIEAVTAATTGFIYAVARMGVTGAKNDVPPEIGELIAKVKSHTKTPVCAGFGFSSPAQIASTCRNSEVDGIVVASALIDKLESTPGSSEERIAAAVAMARELKAATRL
jgi:tryptophan synthase alpha chain